MYNVRDIVLQNVIQKAIKYNVKFSVKNNIKCNVKCIIKCNAKTSSVRMLLWTMTPVSILLGDLSLLHILVNF